MPLGPSEQLATSPMENGLCILSVDPQAEEALELFGLSPADCHAMGISVTLMP